MKTCVYINLAAAEARRRSLEASFAAAAPAGWRLERFEALGPADVADVPGAISPAEKACFASHRMALARCLDSDDPVFVLEDDALVSPQAFALADAIFAQGAEWDVVFGDTVVSDLALMVRLAKRRDAMLSRGQFEVMNLAGRLFFAASAYVVRGAAKRTFHDLLAAETELDTPYDIFLRQLCHAGRVKAGVFFPYATTVAPLADASQIQPSTGALDRALNAYRRLMYVGRDLADLRAETQRLEADYCDEVSSMVGKVFATIVSPAFPSDS
jgi:GR25 family glycosyltransferase involved in LPS biosynthesis